MKKVYVLALLVAGMLTTACGSADQPANQPDDDRYGGMTLYTVRAEMDATPRQTLQQVADMGYKYIEATGYDNTTGTYYGMAPKAFAAYLDSLQLVPISTHQGGLSPANIDSVIADVDTAGFTYLVIPVPPLDSFTYNNDTQTMGMTDNLEELTQFFNMAGQKADSAGLQLLYHNHDFEFKEDEQGRIPYDYFLQNTDPQYVNFQMDLYWVTKAGASPLAYFEKYPGRFKMWHLKDIDEQGRFAPVGYGSINFRELLTHKKQAGMQYGIVEQDQTYNFEPLQAVRISHDSLKAMGFDQ